MCKSGLNMFLFQDWDKSEKCIQLFYTFLKKNCPITVFNEYQWNLRYIFKHLYQLLEIGNCGFLNSYLDVYKWVHNPARYHWESKNIVEPLFPIKTYESAFVTTTVSLQSCKQSKNKKSFNDKIHYKTMIPYLNYMKNKKKVLATKKCFLMYVNIT